MRTLLEIALTGLTAVRLYPLRSTACVIALVAVLLPYVVGEAVARGLEAEAEASVRFGADLHVMGSQFGRAAAVPMAVAEQLRGLKDVRMVAPRIVGGVVLGKERTPAVLVGLASEQLSEWNECIDGSLPRQGGPHELVIGTSIARKLGLKIGSVLPPFYRNDLRGERTSKVVGVFKSDSPLWQASLILTTFESAAAIFEQEGLATDLLVWCQPGTESAVARAIADRLVSHTPTGGTIRLRVMTRQELIGSLPLGGRQREVAFNLHFLLAISASILVLVVTSGIGLSERRREIGILKATGWQTEDVLLRSAAESLALSVASGCIAFLGAWVWLRVFNGYGLASIFLTGAAITPDFRVPYRLTPVPLILAFVFSSVVGLSGTLYSTWRASTAAPREALR
ncbi:MAG TPA: ABC transporter permease [Gemmata sp.]|jgi:ABC-type lipoprotein release transport system permease subunit|nr:ABC transporter permease [Gemmata sp.]